MEKGFFLAFLLTGFGENLVKSCDALRLDRFGDTLIVTPYSNWKTLAVTNLLCWQ